MRTGKGGESRLRPGYSQIIGGETQDQSISSGRKTAPERERAHGERQETRKSPNKFAAGRPPEVSYMDRDTGK